MLLINLAKITLLFGACLFDHEGNENRITMNGISVIYNFATMWVNHIIYTIIVEGIINSSSVVIMLAFVILWITLWTICLQKM